MSCMSYIYFNLKNVKEYHKIPIISPGLIFVQKAVLLGLFRGCLYSEELITGRNFAFQNGLGLTIKHLKTLRKQPNITATTYSQGAYLRESLLSKGFLRLSFEGLIFGRAYSLGGAYYRNWPLFYVSLMNKQQISSTIVHIFAFKLEMLDNQLGQLFLSQISSCFHFHFYA